MCIKGQFLFFFVLSSHYNSSLTFERRVGPTPIKGSTFPTLSHFKCAFESSIIKGSAFPTLPHFECAFEPSTIKGSAFPILPPLECALKPSPYFFSNVPSSPRPSKVVCFLPYLISSAPSNSRPSKVVHFLSYLYLSVPSSPHLISFRVRLRGSAFSILPLFKCAFEPSPHFFWSALSSPRPSKVVHFLSYFLLSVPSSPHLLFFECAFEPSTMKGRTFPTLPHFECVFEPSIIKGSAFPTLPPFECAFEPSPYFFSSAFSSPRPSKVVPFLSYLFLSAPSSLDHQK
jgi:hypothetical protein